MNVGYKTMSKVDFSKYKKMKLDIRKYHDHFYQLKYVVYKHFADILLDDKVFAVYGIVDSVEPSDIGRVYIEERIDKFKSDFIVSPDSLVKIEDDTLWKYLNVLVTVHAILS